MIRVLHFAHVINRFDIIDTVLTRLDRTKFEVAALTAFPTKREAELTDEEHAYPTKVLNFPFVKK